jgi:hypothetical protein
MEGQGKMDEAVKMGNKDIDKLRVIRDLIDGKLNQAEASALLKRSDRQIRRLRAKVRIQGNRGILHGLCGRPSNNRVDDELLGQALSALHDPLWEGFGPTFAMEKLDEYYDIELSEWTVRKLMVASEIWKPRRRGNRHRSWRPRRLCVGMLVQLDGSDHDWFEGRGPRCVLIIYIDDASSRILYGEFAKVEDTLTLMRTTRTYLRRRGRPLAFYVDKDGIYKINRQASIDEELRDHDPMTQFSRAMDELGIEMIFANSPQAKGRVERGFDTHQDRLVKELRLRGMSTIEAANRYLWNEYIPRHNERFAIKPADSADVHRPLLPMHDLDKILSQRTERCVAQDFVVRFQNRHFQIVADQPLRVRPKDQVFVEQRLDGSIHIRFKGSYLKYKNIARPQRLPHMPFQPKVYFEMPRKHSRPTQDHPWRRSFKLTPTPKGISYAFQ